MNNTKEGLAIELSASFAEHCTSLVSSVVHQPVSVVMATELAHMTAIFNCKIERSFAAWG